MTKFIPIHSTIAKNPPASKNGLSNRVYVTPAQSMLMISEFFAILEVKKMTASNENNGHINPLIQGM
jgi:hypothetical protein